MNDLGRLKAAFKRRGYAVLDRTDAEFPNMIILWIACDDGHPVESAPGIQRVVWQADLEPIASNLAEHCDRMLASMSGGQWHMRCANCDAPLLLAHEPSTRPQIVPPEPVHPLDFPERWILQAQVEFIPIEKIVYRSARSGPKSDVLTQCPQCQIQLTEQTVQEIDDTTLRLGEVMADLEETWGQHVRVQSGMQRAPLTIAEWRAQMIEWGEQGTVPKARAAYQKIPGVVFAHPVELRKGGSEIWSVRTGQPLFKVLREKEKN